MYYKPITSNADIVPHEPGETALRAYFSDYDAALGHAAVILGGRRGARLVNASREALCQPGPVTRRLRRQLLELRHLLFGDFAHDENWSDGACVDLLEPDNPIVTELCLLADGLDAALRGAGLLGTEDEQAA